MGYVEASLDTQDAIDEFKKTTGHTTVPQIYLATDEQEYIGGYEDLEKFILEMIDWRRKQVLMGNPAGGVTPQKTVTVREHGNRGISIDVSKIGYWNIGNHCYTFNNPISLGVKSATCRCEVTGLVCF